MSERLRRLTRNQLGSARVGSNPARCELLYCAKQAVPLFYTVRFVMIGDRSVTQRSRRRQSPCAAMSERLRRLTRNQLGSARVGSNPARCELLYCAKQAVRLFCTVRFVMVSHAEIPT
uniref:Integron gene cassette protein n=1 Tax=Heterorhabditis bacteriophora TaxID=37862 RepID=A0A1I7WCJ0_HETBA